MNIFLFVLLLMLTLNFHSIVKEVFKNSKWVYASEYSFKPKNLRHLLLSQVFYHIANHWQS